MLLVAMAGACGGDSAEQPAPAPATRAAPAQIRFTPELGVVLDSMERLPNGVHVRDVRRGTGAAVDSASAVVVAYRAWLPDGTMFEQRPSPDGFGPSEFVIGESAPVPGLNAGMLGMRAGGVRRIVVPAELGYGLVGRPEGVPADVPLLFEVTLRGVR